MASRASDSIAFRLTAVDTDLVSSFPITTERIRIGSQRENELVLEAPGVSRHHATLEATDYGIEVTDAGSKNGTFVNGSRIERRRMVVGDELDIGSITLRLEAAHPDDGSLALIFETDSDALGEPVSEPPDTDLGETELLAERTTDAPLLGWLEDFTRLLSSGSPSRLPDALAVVLEALGARAAVIARWSRSDSGDAEARGLDPRPPRAPALVATAGESERIGAWVDDGRSALRRAASRALHRGQWQLEVVGFDGPVMGLMPTSDDEVLVLALLGGVPGRATCGPLLRLICTLLMALPSEARRRPGDLEHSATANPGSRLRFPSDHISGRTPPMRGLYREMETVAGGSYPVLIFGETGSGKEMLAQTLHRSSARAEGPMITINCAAIPAHLLEAEMFGVVKGAATGVEPRRGCFQRAEGGTLFLDEVGELRTEVQAKLLRALEYGEVQPVGGAPSKVDVRVVSATNLDLERRSEAGLFRADLYFRLAAAVLHVPPLRQRRGDLPRLVQVFVGTLSNDLHKSVMGVTQHALDLLADYPWPGNVRELRHELRQAILRTTPGQPIDSSRLSEKLRLGQASVEAAEKPAEVTVAGLRAFDLETRLAETEEQVIRSALEHTHGNRTLAAELLGIARNTLAAKIGRYDLAQVGRDPNE